MSVPTQINIAELDFDQILTNLVSFMKTDPAFADYDFAGSGLRLLARVLAYSIFYQNYYLTSAVNEAFLDTAQLRSSVASHARMLGYEIAGTHSARFYANTSLEMSDTSATEVVLPALTQFVLTSNTTLSFYNPEDTTCVLNANSLLYEAAAVELIEGTPLQYRFVVDLTNPAQQFVVPNANIDYTTIAVQVQTSVNSDTVTNFFKATNYLTIQPTDPVFFVSESYNGYPEIKFGNEVIGKSLDNGNVVIVSYFVSHGEEGNNIRGPFRIPAANIVGFSHGATYADSNTAVSIGGSNAEDLDNARFMAPAVYQTQNRAVTASDYKAIVLQNYGESIAAINVFGGEQGNPDDPLNRPIFGRVFIVLKPKIGLRFTDTIRTNIENTVLKPRAVIGVIPEVIDPDYVYIVVATSVRYDPKYTTRTRLQLQEAVANSVLTYAEMNVEKFDTAFRFSKFVRVIDDTDNSITGSLTRLDLEKRVYPALGVNNQFILKFNLPIRKSDTDSAVLEVTSHRFTYPNDAGVEKDNCFFYEQDGNLSIAYRNTSGGISVWKSNIGTVDANTGLISITSFAPTAIEDGALDVRIRVIPTVNDFTPTLNRLFTIDSADIQVQLLNDATATLTDQTNFFSGGILP